MGRDDGERGGRGRVALGVGDREGRRVGAGLVVGVGGVLGGGGAAVPEGPRVGVRGEAPCGGAGEGHRQRGRAGNGGGTRQGLQGFRHHHRALLGAGFGSGEGRAEGPVVGSRRREGVLGVGVGGGVAVAEVPEVEGLQGAREGDDIGTEENGLPHQGGGGVRRGLAGNEGAVVGDGEGEVVACGEEGGEGKAGDDGGGVAPGGGAVPQLAVGVPAPGVDRPVLPDEGGEEVPRRGLNDVVVRSDPHGGVVLRVGAVPPPLPDGSVVSDGQAAGVAGGDGPDGGKAGHLHGGGSGGGGAVPQLAVVIVTPGPHGAVVPQGEVVVVPGGDLDDLAQAVDALGGRVGRGIGRSRPELAVIVPSPDPHGAVVCEGQGVLLPRLHLDEVQEPGDLRGDVPVRSRHPQLALGVVPPREEPAVAADGLGNGQGVVPPGGDGVDLARHGDGGEPLGVGSVPQLAEEIVPPGVEVAVGVQREGEGLPRRGGDDLVPQVGPQVDGGKPVGGGPVAELAAGVVAPAPQGPRKGRLRLGRRGGNRRPFPAGRRPQDQGQPRRQEKGEPRSSVPFLRFSHVLLLSENASPNRQRTSTLEVPVEGVCGHSLPK